MKPDAAVIQPLGFSIFAGNDEHVLLRRLM
jgi:hypothetical protein